jgi:hypothetical protein
VLNVANGFGIGFRLQGGLQKATFWRERYYSESNGEEKEAMNNMLKLKGT